MKLKRCIFICLIVWIFCYLCVIADAGVDDNLSMAKKYEGNFYNYHTSGDWNIYSDNGVNLGTAIPLTDDSVKIEYYINADENYVIQYYKDDYIMSYAVWQNDTVKEISSSR